MPAETPPPSDLRELFRYERSGEVRIYALRVIPPGVELWRTTAIEGGPPVSLLEDDFATVEEAVRTLDELQQRLTAGGWRVVTESA